MDYQLLFNAHQPLAAQARWSQQRQLHDCLRSAIRKGTQATAMG